MTGRYTYQVAWSDEDGEYVGLCAEFPLLSWLAPDRDEALAGIRALVDDCVDDMRACGEPLPEAVGESAQIAQGFFMPSGSPTNG